MRIAFFGSSLVSAYWNGAATYYRGILRALAARGHEITFYEPDAFERQQHRDIEPPDWARVVVYAADADGLRAGARRRRGGADLVVKASGVGVLDDELEAGVLGSRRGRRAGRVLGRRRAGDARRACAADPDDPLRALLPDYDLVLTYGGGEPVVDAYRGLGARRCVPIYNALDPDDPPSGARPTRASRLRSRASSATGCPIARRGSRSSSSRPPPQLPEQALPARRQRLGRQAAAGQRAPGSATSPPRDHNAFNCSARCGAQHQPRQHGAQRLLAGDPGLRGGRRRRLPDHRPLGRHRDVPRARARGPGRARRRRGRRPAAQRSTPAAARRDRRRGARARARPSTPTRSARWRSRRRSRARGAGRSRAARERGGVHADRRPRPLDHLVLGQRPRHDLPRRCCGRSPSAATRSCSSSATCRGIARHRDLPQPPFCRIRALPRPRPSCGSAVRARACAEADLVIVGSYVPDGVAVGALGAGDRDRRRRVLRHRHAGHARQARARRPRVPRRPS